MASGMTLRQLYQGLRLMIEDAADDSLDRVAVVRVQHDDGSTYVGGLFSASLEVPCGSVDDVPELVLDGSCDIEPAHVKEKARR